MLIVRITLPHFAASSAMNLPKAAGEPGTTVLPSSVNRALISGSERAAFDFGVELVDYLEGVLGSADASPRACPRKPAQTRPLWGRSGSAAERVAVVTASARSSPALMCSIDCVITSNMTWTRPR